MEFLYGIIVLLIAGLIVASMIIASKAVQNAADSRDTHLFKNYYSTPMKADEIYRILSEPACVGDTKCTFLADEGILVFHHYTGMYGTKRYRLTVTEAENYSILTLSVLPSSGNISLGINGFLKTRLNAMPVSVQ